MTEPTPVTQTNPTAGDSAAQNNPADTQQSAFDPTTISDEHLAKVLEDKRFWKLPRIQELQQSAKKAKEFEAQQAKAEEDRLVKQKEFETLAEKRGKEAEEWRTKYTTTLIDSAISTAALQKGAVDADAVSKLIDKSSVTLNEDGTVTGVAEALDKLAQERGYLFSTNTQKKNPVGAGTNPATPNSQGEFTLSQIQDPKFYQEHYKEIQIAMAQGRIKNDLKF